MSKNLFIGLILIILSSFPVAHATDGIDLSCIVYSDLLDEVRAENSNFDRMIIRPLRDEQKYLNKQIKERKKTPPKLKKKNNKLSKEIGKLETKKKLIENKINNGKKVRKNEKKLIKVEAKIISKQAEIESNNERIQRLGVALPTLHDLKARFDTINRKLDNQEILEYKNEKNLQLAQKTLTMCINYHVLLRRHGPD